MRDAAGVVITGVYGVGKSSIVEEMAEMLEREAVSYGAIDVDWLWWFDATGVRSPSRRTMIGIR